MKSKLYIVIPVLVAMLLVSEPAFAQDAAAAAESAKGWMGIGAGLAIGLSAFGAGMGQGRTGAAAMEGVARNPQTASTIQTMMIIALAFMEALGIYGLLIGLKLAGLF